MLRIARPGVAAGAAMLAAASLIALTSQAAFAVDEPQDPTGTSVVEQQAPVEPTDAPAGDSTSATEAAAPAANADPANPAFVDTLPDAVDDSYVVEMGSTLIRDAASGVLINDSDQDGDPISSSVVDYPTHGVLSYLYGDGSLSYTPYPGFVGTDTLTYRISDGYNDGNVATVTLNVVQTAGVNHGPVAQSDAYVTAQDTPLTEWAPGFATNDFDPDGDVITQEQIKTLPANGSIAISPNLGEFTYTPSPGFTGLDYFTYIVSDGSAWSNETVVNLNVVPSAYPVSVDDAYSTVENTLLSVAPPGFIANDTDKGGPAQGQGLSYVLVSPTSHGVLSAYDDGSFSYQPDSGFVGSDSFSYALTDGTHQGNTAIVTIVVTDPLGTQPTPPPVPGDPGTPGDPGPRTTQLTTLAYTGTNAAPSLLLATILGGLGVVILVASGRSRRRIEES